MSCSASSLITECAANSVSIFVLVGTNAPAYEPRGRNTNWDDRKSGGNRDRGRDSSGEASLTREKTRS